MTSSPVPRGAAALAFALLIPLAGASTSARAEPQEATLALGRAAISHVEVAQGSVASRSISVANSAGAPAKLTGFSIDGAGVTVELVRNRRRDKIASGEPAAFEVPPNDSVRLEVTIDASGLELGSHEATIVIESDVEGANRLELPVQWEVVEPRKNVDDDLPPPKPTTDWRTLATGGPPPRVECDRYQHDFGKVLSGERLRTQFKIRNTGEGDLVIVKVGAQCHCTLPRLVLPGGEVSGKTLKSKENYGTLKPGEEATLDCEVDTAGMGGSHSKSVTIYTNDLAHSPQSIRLSMVVDKPFEFSPASLVFGQVRRTARAERVVRMSSTDQGEFEIVGYELPQPQVMDVDFQRVKPRKGEQCAWELTVTTREGLDCREHLGRLRLELDHPRVKAVDQLHYSLKVLPDVVWTVDGKRAPDSIIFGVVRDGKNDVKSIVLENLSESAAWTPRDVTVTSRAGSEPFRTEVIELEAGRKYEIRLQVVSAPVTKAFSGELAILSDSPAMPELRLKFQGIWSAGGAKTSSDGAANDGK